METPDFLVVEPLLMHDDQPSFENIDGVFTNPDSSVTVTEAYEVTDQGLLGSVSNSLFAGGRNDNLHIKTEHIESAPDIVPLEATDDENVAVEALRQLGNSDYSGNRPKVERALCCAHCNITMSSQQELVEHVGICKLSKSPSRANNSVLSNICPICTANFDCKNDLNNHLVCHAVGRPHACRICGALFIQKQDLLDHLVIHGTSHENQCKMCGQQFSRPSSLTNHMKIHNYQPGRAMNVSRITDTNELEDILTGNSDPELHSVQKSQKIALLQMSHLSSTNTQWNVNYEPDNFTSGMNLSDINPSLGEKLEDVDKSIFLVVENCRTEVDNSNTKLDRPYVCDKCSKGFAREKALLNHMNLHLNDQDFSCERCDQNMGNASTPSKHLQFCGIKPAMKTQKTAINDNSLPESNQRKVYKHLCDQCNKSFPTKQKLFRHVWIHRKKSFTCEVCSSIFDTDENLKNHRLASHQPTSPYVCLKCGKNFCTRQGLWEHDRTHTTNVNNFHCDECNKSFSSRQGYLIHQRKHADERPYGCKYCQKSFRDGGTLRKHERIHTGERPHACPICTKAFNQKVVLREHVRVHSANTALDSAGLYQCVLCTSKFGDKEELSAHLVSHSDKLAQLAKEASKNNITKQRTVQNKKSATEVKVVVATIDQVLQEQFVDVDNTDFVQLQSKELLRMPELKMECITSEDLEKVTRDNDLDNSQ